MRRFGLANGVSSKTTGIGDWAISEIIRSRFRSGQRRMEIEAFEYNDVNTPLARGVAVDSENFFENDRSSRLRGIGESELMIAAKINCSGSTESIGG